MKEETFGDFVRRHRKIAGLTQEALGVAVGVSKGYISQIENDSMPPAGEPPRVDPEKIGKLARAIGVDHSELVRRSWLGQVQPAPADSLPPDERIVIERYRNLRGSAKAAVDVLLFQGEGEQEGEEATLDEIQRRAAGEPRTFGRKAE